jgi:flagellar protein FliS
MQSSARENYLVTDVMTAAPQKLQLMLIEAATRSAQRAHEKWLAGDDAQASKALIHAQEVVGELLAGLNREGDAELVKRVASVYLFVFRSLMEANHERNQSKLDGALKVLEIERETWRQVCQRLGSRQALDGRAAVGEFSEQPAAPPPVAAGRPPFAGRSPGADAVDDSAASSLSLEA